MMSKTIYKNNTQNLQINSTIVTIHRGVSEIIVTLILLSVTVVGAVLVFTAFQGTGITEELGGLSGGTQGDTRTSIKIIGHDTRDGLSLANITGLDNVSDDQLTNEDMIVLHIRNTGNEEFPVDRVIINNIRHDVDISGSGTSIVSSQPSSGTFKIIRPNSSIIQDNTIIFPSSEARLVIKLSDDFASSEDPIELNQHLRIEIFPTKGKEFFQVIESGSLG